MLSSKNNKKRDVCFDIRREQGFVISLQQVCHEFVFHPHSVRRAAEKCPAVSSSMVWYRGTSDLTLASRPFWYQEKRADVRGQRMVLSSDYRPSSTAMTHLRNIIKTLREKASLRTKISQSSFYCQMNFHTLCE